MFSANSFTYFLQVTTQGSLLDQIDNNSIIDIINRGIAYALIIAGILSVVFIFVGGFSFILSGGQEDKIKQAVSTIRYSIIGLIITILAVIIVNLVGRFIGLNTIDYLNFSEIIHVIEQISDDIRGTSKGGSVRSLQ